MRLDKYIASVTDFSRTEVKRLIKRGDIEINHITANNPASHIKDDDRVYLLGEQLSALVPRYFMLYKPAETICATEDSQHPTVIDLLADIPRADQLQIAGRLDKDTTGLVLLTDDGQWNHRVTAPQKGCFKTYLVDTSDNINDEMCSLLESGVMLHNEKRPTLPAKVIKMQPRTIQLSIQEGKYHQVKRMLAAVGNRVCKLHRTQIGPIALDPHLKPGEFRALTAEEASSFN